MSDGNKVDITKIRPGDKVTLVPLEVCATDDAFDLIYVTDHEGGACFTTAQIAAHHPAPRKFQVGDRVRTGGISQVVMTIIAMDGDEAWVKTTSGKNFTAGTSDLTLVEGGE